MSTGGGKINAQMAQQQAQAQANQNRIFEQMLKKSPEQERWDAKSASWDKWVGEKNYASAPKGDILDFDLWNPANVQKQRERMGNLEGVGAAGLGGGGDKSIALGLSKERNANAAAEDAGASYEQAIKGRNAYYEGNALPYAQLEMNKLGNLLGDSSNNAQFYSQQNIATRRQSLLPSILGGVLSAGGAIMGASMGMPGLGSMGSLFGGGQSARGRPG